MVQIVLNDEQAALLRQAGGSIRFVDRTGRDLGQLVPASSAAVSQSDPDIAIALERMNAAAKGGVFYSTSEVLAHLRAAESQ